MPKHFFWSVTKHLKIVNKIIINLNKIYIYIGPVLVKDMQTAPPALLKRAISIFLVQIVAQCYKTNEKSIFQFLRFFVFLVNNDLS